MLAKFLLIGLSPVISFSFIFMLFRIDDLFRNVGASDRVRNSALNCLRVAGTVIVLYATVTWYITTKALGA